MPVEKTIFNSSYSIKWQWPITVGLTVDQQELKPALLKKKWPLQFAKIETVPAGNKTRAHYNIVILNEFSAATGKKAVTYSADIVLLFMSVDAVTKAGQINLETLQTTAKLFNASGIFLISIREMSDWFANFIVSLSHNQDVVTALENTIEGGYFCYDVRLKEQTTLSYLLNNLVTSLQEKPALFNPQLNINTRLTDQVNFTPQQLADLLLDNKGDFFYISESGDASSLHEIMAQVFQQMNVAKETKSNPKSKPPKAIITSSPKGSSGTFKKAKNSGFSAKKFDIDFSDIKFDFPGHKISEFLPDDLPQMAGIEVTKRPVPFQAKRPAPGSELTKPKKSAKPGSPPKKEKDPPPTGNDQPRYLQAKITNEAEQKAEAFLLKNKRYRAAVRIGLDDKEFKRAEAVFDTKEIFKDESSVEETIQISFRTNTSKGLQAVEIVLPRYGNSTVAEFDFTTAATPGKFIGNIYAFHKGRLIQEVEITADVLARSTEKPGYEIKMSVVTTIRNNLAGIQDRTPFTSALIIDGPQKSNTAVHGLADNKPIELYFSDALQALVKKIKEQIEQAVININDGPPNLYHKDNVELLLSLARKGYDLYHNHFRQKIDASGPLQIITNREEYVPLDFMYTFPPPAKTAVLCEHAREALLKGSCKGCIKADEIPAARICPFGFWCFSQVVERHNYRKKHDGNSDYCIVREPSDARASLQILQSTLYASSARVETSETTGIRIKIAAAIKKSSAKFYEASDWANWKTLSTSHDPDSLVLIVHIEENDDEESLEIGQDLSMEKIYLQGNVINASESSAPFIIIFGCESTDIKKYGFDVSSHLINSGAAIVISNLTKIRGRQAGPMVIKLLEFLKQQPLTNMSVGAIILKLRQSLLAEGSMVALTLSAQGDADWKIKT